MKKNQAINDSGRFIFKKTSAYNLKWFRFFIYYIIEHKFTKIIKQLFRYFLFFFNDNNQLMQ